MFQCQLFSCQETLYQRQEWHPVGKCNNARNNENVEDSFLIFSDQVLKIAQKMHNILILLVVLSAVLSNALDKTSYAQLNK